MLTSSGAIGSFSEMTPAQFVQDDSFSIYLQ